MNPNTPGGRSATATFNPQKQSLEAVHRVVGHILGLAGCGNCGRLALLKVDFLGDPGPDLSKDGVISFERQGF